MLRESLEIVFGVYLILYIKQQEDDGRELLY